MSVSISPANKLSSSLVVIYPVVPGEFWLVSIGNLNKIESVLTHDILNRNEDDQGIYYRLVVGLTEELRAALDDLQICYMLINCAIFQEESPECSNVLYVYDLYLEDYKPVDPHLTSHLMSNSPFFKIPDRKIVSDKILNNMYTNKDPLVFFGGSRFPRPLIIRSHDTEQPIYKIIDPYLQWSPPKFWNRSEFIRTIPDNIEGWIEKIINSFNWDYFKSLLENDDHIVDTDHLAASLFEILYNDYIYYSLCKKLWLKDDKEEEDYQLDILVGNYGNQVIVNFTDIVNSIRSVIKDQLRPDSNVTKIDNVIIGETIDVNAFASIYEEILKE